MSYWGNGPQDRVAYRGQPQRYGSAKHDLQKTRPRPRRLARIGKIVLLPLLTSIILIFYLEMQTSRFQAKWIYEYAQQLTFQIQSGAAARVRYPTTGPFNERLGYTLVPKLQDQLKGGGFEVIEQASISVKLDDYLALGLNPPYPEKTQAGLMLIDAQDRIFLQHQFPKFQLQKEQDIPPLLRYLLLFIEDRNLLKTEYPKQNPVIDWDRLALAAVLKAGDAMQLETPSMGGSTLATQIEKYRHSNQGVTQSVADKARQIVSASVRVYRQGEDTRDARQRLVLDYLNTVPLAAVPGYGEVNGIGEGLALWFNQDPQAVYRDLQLDETRAALLPAKAKALRQVLALLIAHRRPTQYLAQQREELEQLVDRHLSLLQKEGIISPMLAAVAGKQRLEFRKVSVQRPIAPAPVNKGANLVRNRLHNLTGLSLYQLDRLDLRVRSTLNSEIQEAVTKYLIQLQEPAFAKAQGLEGEYLLKPQQASNVRYSFTLYASGQDANRVRIQTDNTDQPFDINEGGKLELGSTAKLRVLATYLQMIAELYDRYRPYLTQELASELRGTDSLLQRWVIGYMQEYPEAEVEDLLQAALQRRFSASPTELFYTGGGMHRFSNFKREENGRIASVEEAFRDSLNLPFVRILREVVNYTAQQQWVEKDSLLRDDRDPRREQILSQFIDRESRVFLTRFWRKYHALDAAERMEVFLKQIKPIPLRFTLAYRYLNPNADLASLGAFLRERLPEVKMTESEIAQWYKKYAPDAFNLQDQGYLLRAHPLELWLVGYLNRHPGTSLEQAVTASEQERRQVYTWLLKTKAKNARDVRVRSMLEVEAFSELHRRWREWGYPFDYLVPSLATALGSSGDRPAALAELMGIILGGGRQSPTWRIEELLLAQDTPYHLRLSVQAPATVQVMHPSVAKVLKDVLAEVVEQGTGRRLKNVFTAANGEKLSVGVKTGTGDNRFVVQTASAQRISTRALSRTATLVFYLGERHYGVLTAYVVGGEAAEYQFTSALPAQVLKGMAPLLQPLLDLDGQKN